MRKPDNIRRIRDTHSKRFLNDLIRYPFVTISFGDGDGRYSRVYVKGAEFDSDDAAITDAITILTQLKESTRDADEEQSEEGPECQHVQRIEQGSHEEGRR